MASSTESTKKKRVKVRKRVPKRRVQVVSPESETSTVESSSTASSTKPAAKKAGKPSKKSGKKATKASKKKSAKGGAKSKKSDKGTSSKKVPAKSHSKKSAHSRASSAAKGKKKAKKDAGKVKFGGKVPVRKAWVKTNHWKKLAEALSDDDWLAPIEELDETSDDGKLSIDVVKDALRALSEEELAVLCGALRGASGVVPAVDGLSKRVKRAIFESVVMATDPTAAAPVPSREAIVTAAGGDPSNMTMSLLSLRYTSANAKYIATGKWRRLRMRPGWTGELLAPKLKERDVKRILSAMTRKQLGVLLGAMQRRTKDPFPEIDGIPAATRRLIVTVLLLDGGAYTGSGSDSDTSEERAYVRKVAGRSGSADSPSSAASSSESTQLMPALPRASKHKSSRARARAASKKAERASRRAERSGTTTTFTSAFSDYSDLPTVLYLVDGDGSGTSSAHGRRSRPRLLVTGGHHSYGHGHRSQGEQRRVRVRRHHHHHHHDRVRQE